MKIWKQVLLFACCSVGSLMAQTGYPADSLLVAEDSWPRKLALLPIAGWQRISYRSDLLNCQFSPSCSLYGAQAIRKFGVIRGMFVTADRIVRCNPGAFHYHREAGGKFNQQGFLVDPVVQKRRAGHKSPLTAAMMSALLPGAGRIYNGRWFEGFLGGFLTLYTGRVAYTMYQSRHTVRASVYGFLFILYYGGEIYGAWRTAQYYPRG